MIKKFWPFLFIFIVWLFFAAPYFIFNKTPFPSNYHLNFSLPWAAYEKFWGPVKNNAMPDVPDQIYPWRIFSIDSLKSGNIPLWNPYSFGGTSHIANYQSAAFSPFNILFLFLSNVQAWRLLILIQPLLAGIFTYLFAKSIKQSMFGSLFSAVSFMFSGFLTVWMAYGTLSYAILFLPLALFAVEKFFQTNKTGYLVLLSITFPLSFFSGHFQTSLYFLGLAVLYIIFKSWQTKQFSSILKAIYFVFLGVLLSMPQIIPSMELYLQSVRSGLFEKVESIPLFYFPTIIAPDFFGNPVTRNAILGHYAEWASYAGTIPFLLAIFSIVKSFQRKEILFFLLIGLLSIAISFNTPLLSFLVHLRIPVISTSPASRAIVLFSFSVAILGGFGLDYLLKALENRKNKMIFLWLGIDGVIFAILAIYTKQFPQIISHVALKNLILPILLFLVLGISSIITLRMRKFIPFLVATILILTSFDMVRFASKWMPFDSTDLVYPNTPVTDFYKTLPRDARIYTYSFPDSSVNYRIQTVDGYDPLYVERYGEFIDAANSGRIQAPFRTGVVFNPRGKYGIKTLNFLGINYVLYKKGDFGKPWAFPLKKFSRGELTKVFEDKKFEIFRNNSAYPRAFFVKNYQIVNDKQKIINTMFGKNFDLRRSAVLEENPNLTVSNFNGSANILDYKPNSVLVSTASNSIGLLILTDTYYPGWIAEIDGKPTKILRADYTSRGIVVPPGNHNIKFVYRPDSFKYGLLLGSLGLLGILSYLIYFMRYVRRNR